MNVQGFTEFGKLFLAEVFLPEKFKHTTEVGHRPAEVVANDTEEAVFIGIHFFEPLGFALQFEFLLRKDDIGLRKTARSEEHGHQEAQREDECRGDVDVEPALELAAFLLLAKFELFLLQEGCILEAGNGVDFIDAEHTITPGHVCPFSGQCFFVVALFFLDFREHTVELHGFAVLLVLHGVIEADFKHFKGFCEFTLVEVYVGQRHHELGHVEGNARFFNKFKSFEVVLGGSGAVA